MSQCNRCIFYEIKRNYTGYDELIDEKKICKKGRDVNTGSCGLFTDSGVYVK